LINFELKTIILIHFFKQNKPFLKDSIPDNFIDIHSHLLPGIDDGAATIEDTTMLINGLEEIGFKKFITTPHIMGDVWKNTSVGITEKLTSTVSELKVHNINTRFKAAAEYMMDSEFWELLERNRCCV